MDWKNNSLVQTVLFLYPFHTYSFCKCVSILFSLVNFRYGTEEDGCHGNNTTFTIYNKDGTPVNPEKTVVHKLYIDSGCSISGYCNTANAFSLKVVSKANEVVTVGDHSPGGQVSCHLNFLLETMKLQEKSYDKQQ